MRRIVSPKKSKSKERFNQLIVGLILIFLMFLSVVGYSLSGRGGDEEAEGFVYNGYEFAPRGAYWGLNVQGLEFIFSYSPTEVADINGNLSYLNSYSDLPLYIESESSEASAEVYMNLNQIVLRMQNACINESECEGDLPVKDCTNNFIIIKESNTTDIAQEQGCVFIQGKQEELVNLTDAFLFKIMGIK